MIGFNEGTVFAKIVESLINFFLGSITFAELDDPSAKIAFRRVGGLAKLNSSMTYGGDNKASIIGEQSFGDVCGA